MWDLVPRLGAWCRGEGSAPVDLAAAAPDAWTADKPDVANGLVVLGTPLAFVDAHAQERMRKEQQLLWLGVMTDLQCQWVLLFQSAVPRANHMLRILLPSLSRGYAVDHDNALWQAFCSTFATQAFQGDSTARNDATLPGRTGGLGIRSEAHLAVPAYWAAWVNTL